MTRKQIYIEEKTDHALKDLALLRGVSEAVLVREALHSYLTGSSAHPTRKRNPLYKLIGLCDEGPRDGSESHDRYLYGAKRKK